MLEYLKVEDLDLFVYVLVVLINKIFYDNLKNVFLLFGMMYVCVIVYKLK